MAQAEAVCASLHIQIAGGHTEVTDAVNPYCPYRKCHRQGPKKEIPLPPGPQNRVTIS